MCDMLRPAQSGVCTICYQFRLIAYMHVCVYMNFNIHSEGERKTPVEPRKILPKIVSKNNNRKITMSLGI